MILKGAGYPFRRAALNRASKGGQLYRVLLEKDAEFKASQYVNFFESMHTIFNPRRPHKWYTIEFYGNVQGVHTFAWLSKGISWEFLQANLNAVHPAAEIEPSEDYMKLHNNFEGYHKACAVLELESHYLFNLVQTDKDKQITADIIATLCAAMQNLDENCHVGVQFVLRPVSRKVSRKAYALLNAYKKTGSRPKKARYFPRLAPYMENLIAFIRAVEHTGRGTAGADKIKDLIPQSKLAPLQEKVEAGVYYDLQVRIFVAHKKSVVKPNEILQTVISAFAPASENNRLRPRRIRRDGMLLRTLRIYPTSGFMKEYAKRRVHTYPLQNFVTPAELVTILHYPSKNIPNVVRLQAKKLPVPAGIHTYNSVQEAWRDGAIVFGKSNYRGRVRYLGFKDLWMLMQHAYVIGGTGAGKSYFLTFLALQIARHTGLTFFDVKGDVVDDFMRHLPKKEWNRVVYIDLHDSMRFIPFNILKQENMTGYNLATMIVSTFIKAFSAGSIKEHSASVLRKALLAVIDADPQGSLLEVYRMYTDEEYRKEIVRRMEKGTQYPDVLSYWRDIYEKLSTGDRKTEAGAIMNKLEMITQNERPRFTMCQTDNILNWRKLMDEKKIVLVNLSFGQNEDEILTFFGTLFTSFIAKATFSRDDTPRDQRVPHIFIVDEFERFVKMEGDMKKFLEMARSYGLGMILAHQTVEQVPPKLMGIIKDNTFSQIALPVGADSASEIADMLTSQAAPVTDEDLKSMAQYTGYARFRKLATQAFTFDALDMTKYFESVSWAEVEEWKDDFKDRYYKRIDEIKEDIYRRYRTIKVLGDVKEEKQKQQKQPKANWDSSGKIHKKNRLPKTADVFHTGVLNGQAKEVIPYEPQDFRQEDFKVQAEG